MDPITLALAKKHTDKQTTVLSQYAGVSKQFSYTWRLGTLGLANGLFSSSTTQGVVNDLQTAAETVTIINSGCKFVVFYYDAGGNHLNNTGWLTQKTYKIPTGSHYKLLVSYTDNRDLTNILSTLVSEFAFTGGNVRDVLTLNPKIVPLKWVNGTIYASDPEGKVELGGTTRLVTPDLYTVAEDVVVKNAEPTKCRMMVYYYNAAGTGVLEYKTWASVAELAIPKGKYVKLLASWIGDLAVTGLENMFTVEKVSEDNPLEHIPDYWETHLSDKIKTIQDLQTTDGVNRFSFAVVSDIHWKENYQRSPALLKRLLNECNIKHMLNAGDMITAAVNTKAEVLQQLRDVAKVYNNLGALNMPTIGNHDDNAKWTNDEYSVDLTVLKGEQYSEVFRHLGNSVTYGSTGTYYFIDDAFHKVRFIVLDEMDMSYANVDGQIPYWTYGYRQDQLDWLAETALAVPSDQWSVITLSHMPPCDATQMYTTDVTAPSNSDALLGILAAFKGKTTYTTTTANGDDFDITVNVDFTGKGGTLIACVCGHVHYDFIKTLSGVPVTTTLNDGWHHVSDAPTKTIGTTSEQAFDVFTVDKSAKHVYITRIGAGADREFDY